MMPINSLCGCSSKEGQKTKTPGPHILVDTSATRLSRGDPLGFPPHPRGWLSIIAHQKIYMFFNSAVKIPDYRENVNT
jgi:hypothetical protein